MSSALADNSPRSGLYHDTGWRRRASTGPLNTRQEQSLLRGEDQSANDRTAEFRAGRLCDARPRYNFGLWGIGQSAPRSVVVGKANIPHHPALYLSGPPLGPVVGFAGVVGAGVLACSSTLVFVVGFDTGASPHPPQVSRRMAHIDTTSR